jgi:hypothetical protein
MRDAAIDVIELLGRSLLVPASRRPTTQIAANRRLDCQINTEER